MIEKAKIMSTSRSITAAMRSRKRFPLASVFLFILLAPSFLAIVDADPGQKYVRFESFAPTSEDLQSMNPPFKIPITATISYELGPGVPTAATPFPCEQRGKPKVEMKITIVGATSPPVIGTGYGDPYANVTTGNTWECVSKGQVSIPVNVDVPVGATGLLLEANGYPAWTTKSDTKSVTFSTLPRLVLSCKTWKETAPGTLELASTYYNGETIVVQGAVVDTLSNLIDGATVGIAFSLPSSGIITKTESTSGGGKFTHRFAISPAKNFENDIGTWKITLRASKQGHSSSSEIRLDVEIRPVESIQGMALERVLQNGKLQETAYSGRFAISYRKNPLTDSWGAVRQLDTDAGGKFDVRSLIVGADGVSIAEGHYRLSIVQLESNDAGRWGTRNVFPTQAGRPPFIEFTVAGQSSQLNIQVTLGFNMWVYRSNGQLVFPSAKYATPVGVPVPGILRIVVMRIETWEALLRSELAAHLTAAGVLDDATRRVISDQTIHYGVASASEGQYKTFWNVLEFGASGDEFFTYDEQLGHRVANWMHEMGHRVRVVLLPDSGVQGMLGQYGGEHKNENDPVANKETAYDEAFAILVGVLSMDYSKELSSLKLIHDEKQEYLADPKYKGSHASGRTGNFIEGRIAGLLLNLYAGRSPERAIGDFVEMSQAFRELVGNYPRTVDDWICMKYALDPTIHTLLKDRSSPLEYNIVYDGVLRFSAAPPYYVAFIVSTSDGKDASARLSGGAAVGTTGRVSVLLLQKDDAIATSGAILYLTRVDATKAAAVPYVYRWVQVRFSSGGEIALIDNTFPLMNAQSSGPQFEITKIGSGVFTTGQVYLRTLGAWGVDGWLTIQVGIKTRTIERDIALTLNSEVLISLETNSMQVTVLNGKVAVRGKEWTRQIDSGRTVAISQDGSIRSEDAADLSKIDRWWETTTTTTTSQQATTTTEQSTTLTQQSTTTTDDNTTDEENTTLLVTGFAGAIVVLLAFLLYRRRKPKAASTAQPVVQRAEPTAKPSEEQRFCENCGNKINAGVEYCPICGDRQGE